MKKSLLPMENLIDPEKHICGKEGLVQLLQKHFGYSDFRGKQLEAIEAVLSGKDCFCLMPTGGGKSLCYQIPALAKTGIVLVVSPLIALMENQVSTLKEKGISAEYLSSAQMPHIKEKIHDDLESGRPSLRLLYVTPELVATTGFMSKLSKLYARSLLKLIAIDEAHCISTWGHDFRPSYRKLSYLRKQFPGVPVLALTATAAPKVQKDVIESLCLQNPVVLQASFNRPNIFYEVRYKDLLDDAYFDLSNLLKSSGDVCSIIYCLERNTCDDLSARLSKDGISCGAYHSGLNNKVRSGILADWVSSRIQVVVATVAFGMGIDRSDVRIVCHFNIPKSMEAFYQESGRAGRDGLPSRSLLYYGLDDRRRMEFILKNAASSKEKNSSSQHGLSKKSLEDFAQMVEYCEGSGCRRKKVLQSFGEQAHASLCGKSCDACKHPNLVTQYLEELRHVPSIRQRNGPSPIFISSASLMAAEGLETEFWNRDDEACFSDDDISDSDEGVDVSNHLAKEKFSSKCGLSEKVECLLRAEEAYYQRDSNKKTSSPVDKKAITQTLREASKQRLFHALKQAQQRLGNPMIEVPAAAAVLEEECYKKYGKIGKTFYHSQVASTIRWLSSSSFSEINNRLGTNSTKANNNREPDSHSTLSHSPLHDSVNHDQSLEEASRERIQEMVRLENPPTKSVQLEIKSQEVKLPPIPSFSEFANKRVKNTEPESHRRDAEKRLRLK